MLHVYEENEKDYEDLVLTLRDMQAYYGERKWSYNRARKEHHYACRMLREAISKRSIETTIHKVRPGDLFLMSYKCNDPVLGDHIAVYVGDGEIVHADIRDGVVKIPVGPSIIRRIRGVFRKT